MNVSAAPAYAGVDTHKSTNTLALLDGLGRTIGTWQYPADRSGYERLEERIGDPAVPVGIEGARSYGAGLTAHLQSCGYQVFEMVCPRRDQRRRGKSDPIDAIAAAENLAAGRGLPAKAVEGAAGDLRWLMKAREHLVQAMTSLSNCIDSMLVTAPDAVRARYAGMSGEPRMRAVSSSRASDACHRSMRALARQWLDAKRQADALESEIEAIVIESYPALIGARCVGAITAARLVVAAGSNPERMGGEAAFSMLCGTSPIPASSGRTDRHRLNRGGDRQANRAIHEIARSRMVGDERTRAYVAKKLSEGKTKKEAIRCLCRFIAREVYRLLTGPQEPLPDRLALAGERRNRGLSQSDVANAMQTTVWAVSRLERGQTIDSRLLRLYESVLPGLKASSL